MANDESRDFYELLSAFLNSQSSLMDQFEHIQKAYRTVLPDEKYFEKLRQYQIEWQHSISLSLNNSEKIKQYISQAFDTTALTNQIADIVRKQNLELSFELAKKIDLSLFEQAFPAGTLSESNEVIDRCVATLEKATPYMPDDVNREIQDTVIDPAKKNQLSIDTLLSIISIVLTILIFVFEQATGWISQQENKKDLVTLCESNQQLSGEIDELGRTIQQLTNEVSELNERLDSFREGSLNEDDSDGEETEADSLDEIDNNQQSEPPL